jgi:diguanylate cyclase (GGDEF)-like protein
MTAAKPTTGRTTRSVPVERVNAETLVWQSRIRLWAAAFAAALVLVRLLGDQAGVPAGRAIGALIIYAGITLLVAILARGASGLPGWVHWLMLTADIAVVFAVTGLSAPPQDYPQALIAGFAVVQFAEFTHGRRVARAALWMIVVAYLALIRGVTGEPAHALEWMPQFVTLALFAAATLAFIGLYGGYKERLGEIVNLFRRAEEGDFDAEYPVGPGSPRDSVTMVGRAYNRVRAQLANLVLTDPLSGCLNRRGLEQNLAREIARAVRTGKELALLAIDVDHFKAVNDTLGHLAGDSVIQEVGELLRGLKRGGDVLARIGGDEFALLLPETGAAGAFRVASRIREEVRQRPFRAVAGRVPVTVSVGLVADRAMDENVAHDLHSRADEALYAAKESGRDRVTIWNANMRAFVITRTAETAAARRPTGGSPPNQE